VLSELHDLCNNIAQSYTDILGLKCKVDEIDTHRLVGNFSSLIISTTNAMTGQLIPQNSELLGIANGLT
jgi:hypothetical protein